MARQYSLEKLSCSAPGHLPPERRRCRNCRRVMRPRVEWRDARPGEEGLRRYGDVTPPQAVARVLWYGYGPEQFFCTLRCGYAYACRSLGWRYSAGGKQK